MGSDIERRLTRVETVLRADECVCDTGASGGALEIVIVEAGWDEERIRAAEDAKRVMCPVHGRSNRPVLRLQGSDVYG